ncbi:MAG: VOC family protein [Acidimicrobiia bacterium]|nr:VOC family protein [Acidimicrobiia bacterium]NNC75067.1 VOC family protein [Acidimicrobiia bacterium]
MGKYPHGLFTWADLASVDIDGAKAFYAGLLGWDAEDQFDPDGNFIYTMFSKDGKTTAGLGKMPDELAAQPGMPGGLWSSYVNVDDADSVIQKATANGGTVMMPAMDVMTSGRMAFLTDPSGATFGIWQARDFPGAGVFNEHGAMTWNELATRDVEGARAFYEATFGWGFELMQEAPEYWGIMLDTKVEGDGDADDNMNGGVMAMGENFPPEMPPFWGVYFQVDDAAASIAKASELGGSVAFGPMDTNAGVIAVLSDPQGGAFSVIQVATAA